MVRMSKLVCAQRTRGFTESVIREMTRLCNRHDAVNLSHMVAAEYGNQGIDFKCVPREGFGWMNASFQVGLTFLTTHQRRAVAALQHPDEFFNVRRH